MEPEPLIASPPLKVAFIVLVHGNHGTKNDWNYFSSSITEQFSTCAQKMDKLHVLCSNSNAGLKTHAGFATMGENLANEVHEYILTHLISTPSHIYISIIGHSLGGLIARYAIGLLVGHTVHSAKWNLHTLLQPYSCSLTPLCYMSICTPHLGSRRASHPNLSLFNRIAKKYSKIYCNYCIGKTGKELFLSDHPTAPLLYQLSDPRYGFIQGLQCFQTKTLVACTVMDIVVPYCSASIRTQTPYLNTPQVTQKRFVTILPHDTTVDYETEWKQSMEWNQHIAYKRYSKGWCSDNTKQVEFSISLLQHLQQVEWKRIDVEIGLSKHWQIPLAHAIPIARTIVEGSHNELGQQVVDKLVKIVQEYHHQHCAMTYTSQ